jgi:hypothetical protein
MRAYEFVTEQTITAPTLVPDETIDPDEEWDPKEHSADEVQARITQIEKQIANTPVNQYVDAGNGDKRLLRISPNDATKMEKGINPNTEIQRMPWTGAPQKTLPNVGDMKRGYQT